MKPTRQQCLEWLDEVAEPDRVSPWNAQRDFATITPAEIEALCQRVWNEAIESAAKRCFAEGQADEIFLHTDVRMK